MTGKLRIAINVAAWLAFAAMAEMNVNVIEKPRLPSRSVPKKSGTFFTGLPATRPNAPNASSPSTIKRQKL